MVKQLRRIIAVVCVLALLVSCSNFGTGSGTTYKGVAQGYGGEINVSITVDNDKITKVVASGSKETNGKAETDEAFKVIPERIVANNSINVDVVSGATLTSKGIMEGCKNALEGAGLDITKFGGSVGANVVDGTYDGIGKGQNDDIKVSVRLSNGKIANIKIDSQSETPGIGAPLKNADGKTLLDGGMTPIDLLPRLMVEHQTTNVDAVSGATVTSNALKLAVRGALEKAGASSSDFNEKYSEEVTSSDLTTDVVVVGGGGAGLAAAVAASQQGAKVIVIEKTGVVGGDTLVCGAIYNNPDPELQKEVEMTDSVKTTVEKALSEEPKNDEHKELINAVKKEWDEYKSSGRKDLYDSANWFALQTWNGGDKVANLDLVKVLTGKAYDGLKWIEGLGMKFYNKIGQGAGALWQRTHTSEMQMGTGFISTYVENISKDNNITIMVETTGEKLITDDDNAVVGVLCKNKNGDNFTINAKSVVLATGGFAANSKMVQQYNTSGKWSDLSKVRTTNRFHCSQGDGISMASEIGASLTDMDQLQLLYLGNTHDGQLTKYPPRDVNGTDQIIFINTEGERFTNEGGRRDDICLAVFNQPNQYFYMLESGDGDLYKDINDPTWRSADGFTFEYLKNNEYIYVADTLEELADKLGMDIDKLNNTIEKFNACVDGEADEFGRTLYSTKLTKGPYVATPREACVHHTMGGVTIDTSNRVIDLDGNPIAGLYAAGETTGGIHGGNRLGGNAVVDTVVFGKQAGEEAGRYALN